MAVRKIGSITWFYMIPRLFKLEFKRSRGWTDLDFTCLHACLKGTAVKAFSCFRKAVSVYGDTLARGSTL